jgi:hypothetical protein
VVRLKIWFCAGETNSISVVRTRKGVQSSRGNDVRKVEAKKELGQAVSLTIPGVLCPADGVFMLMLTT